MKKKGFTLIELLAVIVILAIIAIIATPLILKVIENSKKGAFEQSLNNAIKASELYQAKVELTNPIEGCIYFSFGNDIVEITEKDGKTYYPLKELALKGSIFKEGEIKICKEGIVVEVSDGSYSGRYEDGEISISKGDLASNDLTIPVIDQFNTISTTDKIMVSLIAHSQSLGGTIVNYYYKINDEGYIKTTKNSYVFEKLNPETEYTISVKVENKSGITKEDSKVIKTKGFGELTVEVSNQGVWEKSKTVTIIGDSNIEYQIVKYMGSEIIKQGDWTSYSEQFEIKEEATVENPIAIRARYNDGNTTTTAKTVTITTIDVTEPSLTTGNITKTTNSIEIPYTATDGESNIKETTCEYGLTEKYGMVGQISDGKCVLSGLKDGKTYYYKITTTNNVGLSKDVTGNSESGTFGTCNVEITPDGWTSSKIATITGITNGASLQYKINNGEWTNIESGGEVNLTKEATTTNPTTVYCRFNDGINTTDGSSSNTTTKIDNTTPVIDLSKLPTLITKGDSYQLSDYVIATYGESGGTYECASNTNGVFTDLNQLDIGTHDIQCTATGNTGISSKNSITVHVFNPNYVMLEGNDIIWEYLDFRTFYKANSGWTLAAYAYMTSVDYIAPILVSDSPEAVMYNAYDTDGGVYISTLDSLITMEYLGKNWYISSDSYWFSGDSTSTEGKALKITVNTVSNDGYAARIETAKYLIDEALK